MVLSKAFSFGVSAVFSNLSFTTAAVMAAGRVFYSECEHRVQHHLFFMGLADNELRFKLIVFRYKCGKIAFFLKYLHNTCV